MKQYKFSFSIVLIFIVSIAVIGCEKREVDKNSENTSVRRELTDDRVRSMVREYLEKCAIDVGAGPGLSKNYDIANAHIEPIGDNYRIISVRRIGMQPSGGSAWIVCSSGVHEIEPSRLTQAFMRLPAAKTTEEKQELIDKYLTMLHYGGLDVGGGSGKVIKSIKDIEGYQKNPLDTDLESSICAPYTIESHIRIFYTYNRIGGQVTRYRFQFNVASELQSVDVNVFGKYVGDYHMLQ